MLLNANTAVRSCGRGLTPEPQCHCLVPVACGAVTGVSPSCPIHTCHCDTSGGCKIISAGAGPLLEPLLDAVLVCSWMQPAQDRLVSRSRKHFASFFFQVKAVF